MIGRGTSGSQWNFVAFALAFLYCFGPSRAKPQWRWITSGSAVAAVSWIVVSILFAWYAENFGSFNKTYGSLGAIIGFMLWIWLSTIVVLIGAELNAETEHQTVRDTTTGRPKPLGLAAREWRIRSGLRRSDCLGPCGSVFSRVTAARPRTYCSSRDFPISGRW
jgi:Virulence factor BrkB